MNSHFEEFLELYDRFPNFSYSKVNHGYWEQLTNSIPDGVWPETVEECLKADALFNNRYAWEGGLVPEVDELIKQALAQKDPSLELNFGLSAWPRDNEILGTPFNPEKSIPLLESVVSKENINNDKSLLLKTALHDFSFDALIERVRTQNVLLIGPDYLSNLGDFFQFPSFQHVTIHHNDSSCLRHLLEDEIVAALNNFGNQAVVLLQAAIMGTYWILRLRDKYPNVRWIDCGLSLSICNMNDLLKRPWGQVYRKELVSYHNHLAGKKVYEEQIIEPSLKPLLENIHNKSAKKKYQILLSAYRYLGNLAGSSQLSITSIDAAIKQTLNRYSASFKWGCPNFLSSQLRAAGFDNVIDLSVDDAGYLDLEQPELHSCDGVIFSDLLNQSPEQALLEKLKRLNKPIMLYHLAGMPAEPFDIPAFARIYALSSFTLLGSENLALSESADVESKSINIGKQQIDQLLAQAVDLPRQKVLAAMQKTRLENLLRRCCKKVQEASNSAIIFHQPVDSTIQTPILARFISVTGKELAVVAVSASMANYSESSLLTDWK